MYNVIKYDSLHFRFEKNRSALQLKYRLPTYTESLPLPVFDMKGVHRVRH